jgi:hypothetical protein
LSRIRELAARGQVRFTLKASRELATLGLGLDAHDACEILAALTPNDFGERFSSRATGEWMYVFKPTIAGELVYLKLILRPDCVVVSFHRDEAGVDEEES